MTQTEAMALLVMTKGLFYKMREAALLRAGSALAVVDEPAAYAAELGAQGVAALRQTAERAPELLHSLAREGVSLLARGDAGYPPGLLGTHRPPHLLFCLGQADLTDRFPFAVVGTRRASAYGLRQTRAIARELAASGVCVVSGLAVGIDAQAHRGALDARGRTVAVLGSALDRFYPEENRPLLEEILARGGSVVTEYPPGTPPGRYTFLERNRIIAGMSLGVLVTEGGERSGAQRTVREALEEGREIFALPGNVDCATARLPNSLIAEGAHLITRGADVLRALVIEPAPPQRMEPAAQRQPAQAAPKRRGRANDRAAEAAPAEEAGAETTAPRAIPQGLDADGRAVWTALQAGELDFDALCESTGIDAQELGALLTMMEMDGHVESRPGLRYALASQGE